MVEPVSTGTLVAGALAAGAGALAKGVLGEAAKDAYAKLKAAVAGWAAPIIAELEAKPDSDARAKIVAELVEEQPGDEQAAVRVLAEAVRAALAADGHGTAVDNRVSVIADRGGRAAGRDQYNAGGDQFIGSRRPEPSEDA